MTEGESFMKLIICNRAYSSWSMRGWLALKHAGIEFEELVVPLFDEAWEQPKAPTSSTSASTTWGATASRT